MPKSQTILSCFWECIPDSTYLDIEDWSWKPKTYLSESKIFLSGRPTKFTTPQTTPTKEGGAIRDNYSDSDPAIEG
ncbi:hypothetical protein [Anabaena sp. PCC 7108]|uniref:hypothetical protein n=1 Tax=Anabaena sp. PCC 7108 TaxID=163908 RepID=UPI000349F034|nr:hypothetical protein [Anabaena sp. PCC 7108]